MTNSKSQRPYFFWDYDITEEEVHEILHSDDEARKLWVMGRILERAHFDDVWRYITPPDLQRYFERLRLRPQVREVWTYAIKVWNRDASDCKRIGLSGAQRRNNPPFSDV